MVSFKERCISLRKRGLSINQIAAKTNRPKTSVYFHIQSIPLSIQRKREIRLAAIRRFNDYSRSIKGKSRLNRHPTHFKVWDTDLVSLVSHIMFDGTIKQGGCVYTNRSQSLLDHVTRCMGRIYPYPPKKYESLSGVHKIAFHNVELGYLLRTKELELTRNIERMSKELRRVFLRAFFNDEGSVYFIGKRRAIRGYQHDGRILNLIQRLLRRLGIRSKVDMAYNEVTITRRRNLELFEKEINFSAGVCVNGNRSNSVWKHSFEKRELLRKMLASYR